MEGGKAFVVRWLLVALPLKPVALTHPLSFKTETLRRGREEPRRAAFPAGLQLRNDTWPVGKYLSRPPGPAKPCFVLRLCCVPKRISGSLQKYLNYNRIKIDQRENEAGTNSAMNQEGGTRNCCQGRAPRFARLGCRSGSELPIGQSKEGNPAVMRRTTSTRLKRSLKQLSFF